MAITLPESCPRQCSDCRPLAQIKSDPPGPTTFICIGANDGSTRVHAQDAFRHCVKTDGHDSLADVDKRDLIDQMSVIAQGLSVIANVEAVDDAG